MIRIKGTAYEIKPITNSFQRRAVALQNNIYATLMQLGIGKDQIDVSEKFAISKESAWVNWFFDGKQMYYSYSQCAKYVDNINVVLHVIVHEVELFLSKQQTIEEFTSKFAEGDDVEKERKEARIVLGVDPDEKDIDVINAAYKQLAKKHHPDTASGDTEEFKNINNAHKILKRELT